MAGADYYSCDVCGSKTFYDSDLHYEDLPRYPAEGWDGDMKPAGAGEILCICKGCVEKYELVIIKRSDKDGDTVFESTESDS